MKRDRLRILLALAAVLVLALSVGACGSDDEEGGSAGGGGSAAPEGGTQIQKIEGAESKPQISVGSKNFTEQYVLGEIYAQTLQAMGFKVKKSLDLGSELIAYKALRGGEIDAYPEYTGTALTSFFKVKTADVPRDAAQAYEDAKEGFAEDKITALAPTPFENTYRLGMLKETAERLGNPTKISDLSGKAGDLSITGFPECRQRRDCLLGVQDEYGLKFDRFVASDQTYSVIDNKRADVGFIFTTDGALASGKYQILDDDKSFFPPYNITFAVRNETAEALGPEAIETIERVQKPMTEKVMQELNSRVDIDKQEPEAVAKQYLEQFGFVGKS